MKCRYFCRLPLDISPVYLTRGISDTENPAEKMDMFSVFIGWILLQLYHTFGIWRTAGTDLLYEKRKDTNTGFDAGADDRYDHL